MVWIVDNVVELFDLFVNDVALADPLSLFLFLLGAATIGLSLGAFGLLSLQAIAATLTRD
jgi:hypothetical protein